MAEHESEHAPYETYRGLPPLGGVCAMEEATAPGLSVDESVGRLKRFHYALKRLHRIFVSRLTAEPIYELKLSYSHHGHLCAEHVSSLRRRVGEMREPPLGLEDVPDGNLELYFDEIQSAPNTEELVMGLYGQAIPALAEALRRYRRETHPVADAPSVRLCRFALLELEDMVAFGERALASLVDDEARLAMAPWLATLKEMLSAAGGLDGTEPVAESLVERWHSKTPYVFDPIPQRDERFVDPYNAGVNPEAFLYDEAYPARVRTLMMYYKRIRELDVPEMMASVIEQTPDKPWDYYAEMTRQLWDEARHSMMGEIGFASLGIDWRKIPINFTWSLNINTQLKPIERHAVLFFIEQGLMPKTGKRFEWEVAFASGDPLSATFQDFDWADEVLHSQIGRRWYVTQMGTLNDAIDYGDRCWTQVVSDWKGYVERGLTEHRNWWPELYREACERWGTSPDPEIMNYATTYESQRADLKEIPQASG
ncbi:hypothetical protein Pan216_49850 [Planctomycetes bacterium Pan216]|uniref:DUF455 family protein n=1 Tax=Kolteria novifilia TaxID=2527975 RepID=A0A518BAT9_9BACT|nr:hypothetical protein Pan216_49850 [Planctomycetes bacterium Pan216]